MGKSTSSPPHLFLSSKIILFSLSTLLVTLILHGTEFVLTLPKTLGHPPLNGWQGDNYYTYGFPVQETHFHHVKNGHLIIEKNYRQKPFPINKPEDLYRIMVLGDSYTFGVGIAEEDRYTNQLEQHLREAYPHKNLEVLNFGLMGADTVMEHFILETTIGGLDPNLIVVGFYENDPKQRGMQYSPERENFYIQYGFLVKTLAYQLDLAGLPILKNKFETTVDNVLMKLGTIPTPKKMMTRAYNPEGKEWAQFLTALKNIKKLSDKHNLPVPIFVVLTTGLSQTHLDRNYQAEEAAQKIGFRTFNYEKEIKSEMKGKPLSPPFGGHASKELNHLYGKKLFHIVRDYIDKSR